MRVDELPVKLNVPARLFVHIHVAVSDFGALQIRALPDRGAENRKFKTLFLLLVNISPPLQVQSSSVL